MSTHGEQVSQERLLQLLDQGESSDLDFKRTCDLAVTAELLAIVKDLAAFSALGGHLVVGVNEDGTPSEMFDARMALMFDESRLRAKVSPKYLHESISLTSAVHTIDEQPVAVVFVGAHAGGFMVLQGDGAFKGEDGEVHLRFRAGQVYVRRGTSSVVWNHDEADAALERATAARKETWRAELREDLAGLGLGQQAQQIARGPAASFTWQLDGDAFAATLVELLRSDDKIAVGIGLDAMRRDGVALLSEGRLDSFRTVLDRLAATAALAISVHSRDLFERVLDTFVLVYNQGFDENGYTRQNLSGLSAQELWLEVITRVYALGALAVRRREWAAVRDLALQKGSGYDFRWYTNWLRHALTEASRAGRMQSEADGGRRLELSLLTMAAEHVEHVSALRPDVPVGDDAILSSLTQFDVLAILAAIADARDLDDRGWYTNFARFSWNRSEPALQALLADPQMRVVLFPLPDADLAAALREVSRKASAEGMRFSVWGGWQSDDVKAFLVANPAPESPSQI
ncbi:MAG TPA: ATP-binding protein [Solirubrobacteraceae bacterium]|nr:ATP-binding protein [Solirubrobacteraceae bacterium]